MGTPSGHTASPLPFDPGACRPAMVMSRKEAELERSPLAERLESWEMVAHYHSLPVCSLFFSGVSFIMFLKAG